MTGVGLINIYATYIHNNSYGVFVENSIDLRNSILESEIYENDDFGVQILQSYVTFQGNKITDNLKGYIDFTTNNIPIFGGHIYNNSFVETSFRRSYFPHFYRHGVTQARPVIGNYHDFGDSYLMMALGESDIRIDTKDAIVDTTNASRFYPDISIYDFHDPMPPLVVGIFDDAMEKIVEGDFIRGLELMKEIIIDYPESEYAKFALSYLPNLQITIGSDINDILGFMNNLEIEDWLCEILEARGVLYLFNGFYPEAIEDFEAYKDIKGDTVEALFAELNIIYAQWLLSHGRAVKDIGSELSMSDIEYLSKRESLLSQIFNFDIDKKEEDDLPIITKLSAQNYPNPFNPETTISFALPDDGKVKVEVFNIRGQKVTTLLDESLLKGHHTVVWRGIDGAGKVVGSGVYLYKIQTEREIVTGRMVLLK